VVISQKKKIKVRIGIIGNPKKEDLPRVLDKLRGLLRADELVFSSELEKFTRKSEVVMDPIGLREKSDYIFSIGGDGTFLKAARMSGGKPIAGINLGGLGFLTVFTIDEIEKLVSSVRRKEFLIEKRIALLAKRELGDEDFFALNDITISITGSARMIELTIEAGGELLSKYRADGVIISTPTGSTAYNLASGGPILYPEIDAFIVTPICAHTLSVRSVILPANTVIVIRAHSKGESILLSADGQKEVLLGLGERIEISRAPEPVRILRLKDSPRFFEILRMKLGWG